MDYSYNRDNIPTKTIKNRRPRRNYYHKISPLLILSVITVTLVNVRVYILCRTDI